MSGVIECHLKPYLQPFERELAIRELIVLSGSEPREVQPNVYQVESRMPIAQLSHHAVYWESFHNGSSFLSTQVRYEMSAERSRRAATRSPEGRYDGAELPKRRVLRYGPHDAHEYRGKFFPQLVRAAINLSDLPSDSLIADPMIGSGTTAVEALLSGHRTIGMDLNPLSVAISRSKIEALQLRPEAIERSYAQYAEALSRLRAGLIYFRTLPSGDQEYLERWFSRSSLAHLDRVIRAIRDVRDRRARRVFEIALSNSLRSISYQKDDDLRVRRDPESAAEDPVTVCRIEIERQARLIGALAVEMDSPVEASRANVGVGDIRTLTEHWERWSGRVDLIVTSPPYATALPYLDTDRLSLVYLGLLGRGGHRDHDLRMIGNREVTKRHRSIYLRRLDEQGHLLPDTVTSVIRTIQGLNSDAAVGFRRLNLPSLLSKYFFDMRTAFYQMAAVARPASPMVMVVGNNHTVAGGERIEIRTPQLLASIAETIGYSIVDSIPMDMLTSRDIFRSNAGTAEAILMLRTPSGA